MRFLLPILLLLISQALHAQTSVIVKDEDNLPLQGVTVEWLRKDSSLLRISITDSLGITQHEGNEPQLVKISHTGFLGMVKPLSQSSTTLILKRNFSQLSTVRVEARKPFIELKPGMTTVNLESSSTSAGNTVLEVLEKLPGVLVDKDGNISLKGKGGVAVYLDGRPTYLSGAELASMLEGMNSSTLSTIELIDQPGARYDAAGNAGIINLRTKKIRQFGFNGSFTTSYAQGRYPKNNNSLQLALRSGRWNINVGYTLSIAKNYMDIYAFRDYLAADDKTVISSLHQPSNMIFNSTVNNFRTGIDYTLSERSSIGINISGMDMNRGSDANNTATWLHANGAVDSMLKTVIQSSTDFRNGSLNLNFRHRIGKNTELSADADAIDYMINGSQFFENSSLQPTVYKETFRAALPTTISIYSVKTDLSGKLKNLGWEWGAKGSKISTDNLAVYEVFDSTWKPDYGRSNHFKYDETIKAVYGSLTANPGKFTIQGGLRYEHTSFDAAQLGNPVVKDSSFSRSYDGLFPTLFVTWAADSLNSFSLNAGRRLDRPAFQKLNPFIYVINKYTYQVGNPFFRPQYTWNIELNHTWKEMITTGISYAVTTDYFSQIFPSDSSGLIIYTEGNLGKLQLYGISLGIRLSPAKWVDINAQGLFNHRKMEGFINKVYEVSVNQFTINLNSQFRMGKGWTGEITGFYTSRARNDIQEIVDPAGQLSFGISKTLLKGKGSLRFAVRDVFHTQWMKGFTYFQGATEIFKLTRDTRVASLSFIYRFGKAFKQARRSQGASGEETQRVGTGG